jgi:hypothetical protein
MSEFLKGNFKVARPVNPAAKSKGPEKNSSKEEYRRKAISSVGGSMVFVEMDQLMWDGDAPDGETKKA